MRLRDSDNEGLQRMSEMLGRLENRKQGDYNVEIESEAIKANRYGDVLRCQNPPRHPSKVEEEKLSSPNEQPNKDFSLQERLRLLLERLGFPGEGGWGRKPRASLSERLEREGPRRSGGGRVTINGRTLGFAAPGGVDRKLSESSDSECVDEEE